MDTELISVEVPLHVRYGNHIVGEFKADRVVENKVIVELKSILQLNLQHELQLVNYLVTTGINDGLLINFGARNCRLRESTGYIKNPKE